MARSASAVTMEAVGVVYSELEKKSSNAENADCRSVLSSTDYPLAKLENHLRESLEVALLVVEEHVLDSPVAEQIYHLPYQSFSRGSLHFASLLLPARVQISGMGTVAELL